MPNAVADFKFLKKKITKVRNQNIFQETLPNI